MTRPRKNAKVGSSASFKPTKKQQPKPEPTDPAPRYELRQRNTRYGDIENPYTSSDDEKLELKDSAVKHRRGRPKRANNHIQQSNPLSGEEGEEENAGVLQPETSKSKGKDPAPKGNRRAPKPQFGHVEDLHTPSEEQNASKAPQIEPNTKVKGLGRKGKQSQSRIPIDRIRKPGNLSNKENANLVPRSMPNTKMKGIGWKRKQDQRKKLNVHAKNPCIPPGKENPSPHDLPEPKTKVFVGKGKQVQPGEAKSKVNKAKKSKRKIESPKQVAAHIDVLHPRHFEPSLGLSKYLKDKIVSEEYSEASSEFDSDESQWQESFDIKDNREVFGLPDPDDVKRWKEGAYFIKSNSGLENSRWVGKRPLGQGAFGITGLWQQCNTDGRVKKVKLRAPRRGV